MQPYSPLVDTAWLSDHLDDERLLLCDCRFAGSAEASRAAYLAGHLPHAIHVYWLEDLCAADTSVTTFLPTPEQAREKLGRLGIEDQTIVVGYADTANLYASRLWHVLSVFGHSHVALLDGGIAKWIAEERPLLTDTMRPAARAFHPNVDADSPAIVGREEIRSRLGDPLLQIVDVRAPAEFAGDERRAARGGHIPGALLLPWDGNVCSDHTLRSAAAIGARAQAAGLHPEDEIVTYCQGGVRAAHTAFALSLAGYRNVRVYDGSWAEWGNDPRCPVEAGSSPSLAMR